MGTFTPTGFLIPQPDVFLSALVLTQSGVSFVLFILCQDKQGRDQDEAREVPGHRIKKVLTFGSCKLKVSICRNITTGSYLSSVSQMLQLPHQVLPFKFYYFSECSKNVKSLSVFYQDYFRHHFQRNEPKTINISDQAL